MLERVVSPAEEVVGVCAVALVVVVAEEEGVRAVLGPHLIELSSVPERFVGDLRHAHRMGGGACTGRGEGFFGRVVHVVLVVGRVDVLAVPASNEVL